MHSVLFNKGELGWEVRGGWFSSHLVLEKEISEESSSSQEDSSLYVKFQIIQIP